MRIAHVTDCYLPQRGGIEMQVHDLAAHQRAAGHDVDIFTATRSDATGDAAPEPDPAWVHRVVRARRPGAHMIACIRAAAPLFAAGDYDAVHVHWSIYSPLGQIAVRSAAAAGIPTVITIHSLWWRIEPLPRVSNLALGWSGLPVLWSAVSHVAAEPIDRMLRISRPTIVLPNGIDLGEWKPASEAGPRIGSEVVLASVMRLAPRKRPMRLLRMARQLKARVPGASLRLVIVGEGPERATLESYISRHAMSSWVDLPGWLTRPEIRDVLHAADVYVAPADLESFGIAALEARCAGLPVVAKARGGVGEFITDGLDGFLARSDDGLVDSLEQLVRSPLLRSSMSAHNRRVPPPLGWAAALARTDEAYAAAAGLAERRAGARRRVAA